ncbi:MAG TPA: cellulose biosynthesis protein BcsS [Thiobacillus sp.]|nr:cellulose biosynthesis protein BcsS [Thiobacillus sp.]HQT70681.1 cellulose biosynthesis protein BcsS [Thiobacillus sp.]
MKRTRQTAGLLGMALGALWSVPAQGGVALTGLEASRDNRSAYLGVVLPLSGQSLGQGFVQRYWLDYTGYQYEKQPFQTIQVDVAAVEAALGYQHSSAGSWWAAYLGAHYSDTHLSPADPDNTNQGKQLRAKLQFEGETDLAAGWRVNGIVSHLVGDFNYWTRLRVQTTLANRLHVGPELVVQGDAYYDAYKLGLFVGNIPLGRHSAFTLKGGISQTLKETASLYLGTEFYIPF